jgi:hypothetical protein
MFLDRERVYDWPGGELEIVQVSGRDDGPLLLLRSLGPTRCLPLAHGLAIPADLRRPILVRGQSVGTIEIGVRDGTVAIVAVHADSDHELTSEILRGLQAPRRLARAIAEHEVLVVSRGRDGTMYGEQRLDGGQPEPPQRRRLPQTWTDEHFREVAAVYRDAVARGTSTQRAIQARWKVSPTSARRYVQEARRRGLLGPAQGRKAGERPTHTTTKED